MTMKVLAIALGGMFLPGGVGAQVRASELGVMSQMIDGTKISVEYSRPRARGRADLFGTKAVRWNEVWTPGANWATTLDVNRPIKLNGSSVPKGKYSVWMVVRESRNWTIVLDPDNHRYHMQPPDSNSTQVRIPVTAETAPFKEVLTWSMPDLRMDGGTLAMEWERVRVSMKIEVEPSLAMGFPSSEAPVYLGAYRFVEKDSTGKDGAVSTLTITHEDGKLRARFTPEDNYLKKFALVRVAPDWFAAGVYDATGQIYEVLKPDMVLEFKRSGDKAVGFVIRDGDDKLWGTGTRTR